MKKQIITVSDIFDCCREPLPDGRFEQLEAYCEHLECVLRGVLGGMSKQQLLSVYEYMNDSTEHWKNDIDLIFFGDGQVEFVAEKGEE